FVYALFLRFGHFVADAECLYLLSSSQLAHYGKNGTRIQATAQKHAKRNLRNQPELHTFLEQFLKTAEIVLVGNRFAGSIFQVPVLSDANAAIIHDQEMSRLEL